MSVMITIRRKDLVKRYACSDGLALFDAIVTHQDRKDRIRFRWTALADAYLSLSGHAGWLRDQRLIPSANLYGADLYGADLYGARRPDNAPKGWRSINGYLEQDGAS